MCVLFWFFFCCYVLIRFGFVCCQSKFNSIASVRRRYSGLCLCHAIRHDCHVGNLPIPDVHDSSPILQKSDLFCLVRLVATASYQPSQHLGYSHESHVSSVCLFGIDHLYGKSLLRYASRIGGGAFVLFHGGCYASGIRKRCSSNATLFD